MTAMSFSTGSLVNLFTVDLFPGTQYGVNVAGAHLGY